MRTRTAQRRAYLSALLFARLTSGLRVVSTSACASVCQASGDPATTASDIVCNDSDFFSTSTGSTFKACADCLQNSTAVSGAESDISWLLYNLRYAVDVCLWGFPSKGQNMTSQCATDVACNPVRSSLETGDMAAGNATEYQYCTVDGGAFSGSYAQCSQCLQSTSTNKYLSNFVETLYAGCEQQPAPGSLLRLAGGLFSQATLSGATPTQSATPGSTGSSTLPLSSIIAITTSIGGMFLIALVLLLVYCWRVRKYDAQDEVERMYAQRFLNQHAAPMGGSRPDGGEMADFKTETSSQSHSDYIEPQGNFSSNADYYDKAVMVGGRGRTPPVAGLSMPQMQTATADPLLPAHPAYNAKIVSRHGSRDLRADSIRSTPPPSRLRIGTDTETSADESGYELPQRRPRRLTPPHLQVQTTRGSPAAIPVQASQTPSAPTPAPAVIQLQPAPTSRPPVSYRPPRQTQAQKSPSPIEMSQEHVAFGTPAIANMRREPPREDQISPEPTPPALASASQVVTQVPMAQGMQSQGTPPAHLTLNGQIVPALIMPVPVQRAPKKYSPISQKLQGKEDETISGPLAAPPPAIMVIGRERDDSTSTSGAEGRVQRSPSAIGGEHRPRRDQSNSGMMMGTNRRRLSGLAPGVPDKIVEHRVDRHQYSEMPIGSGKSLLYG